jgi:nucleoside-diphosphate-sugar epimerase
MKILITGHRGFIGSKLFSKLNDGSNQLIGIDLIEGYNLLTCELPENVGLIYHLAAQSQVEPSWSDPLHDLDNIRITARLVKEYPHAKIIYAQSCASLNKSSPYGFSKWASGEYLKLFHKYHVSCVFPNVYGHNSHSVVDIFKGTDKVTIYGDGLQIRDYVYVDDIVKGLIEAQNWPIGEYFMGSGIGTTVLDLANGKEATFAPARKEDREVIVPNTTPNWKPIIKVKEYIK